MGFDHGQYYFLNFDRGPAIWVMNEQDSTNTLTALDIELSPWSQISTIGDQIIYVVENFGDAGSYGSSVYAFHISGKDVQRLGRLLAGHYSYDLFVDDEIVYVATGESLIIAKINESRNTKLSEWQSSGKLVWVDANENQIFTLNSWDNRVDQFEIDSSHNLQLVHEHQEEQVDKTALGDGYIFTAGAWKGIHRYDTTVIPWQEMVVFDLPLRTEMYGPMIIQDNMLYTSSDGDLVIWDISDPVYVAQISQLERLIYDLGTFTSSFA